MPTTEERWQAVLEAHKMGGPEWQQEEQYQPLGASGEVLGMKCAEPDCDGVLRLRWSDRVQRYWYSCSRWPKCQGSLPADRSGAPRGKPRTKELQGWRAKAHGVFDRIWKDKHCSRSAAYAWFRRVMVCTPDQAHIFKQDIEGCQRLIALVAEKGPGTDFWESWYNPRKRTKPGPTKKSGQKRRRSTSRARGK